MPFLFADFGVSTNEADLTRRYNSTLQGCLLQGGGGGRGEGDCQCQQVAFC